MKSGMEPTEMSGFLDIKCNNFLNFLCHELNNFLPYRLDKWECFPDQNIWNFCSNFATSSKKLRYFSLFSDSYCSLLPLNGKPCLVSVHIVRVTWTWKKYNNHSLKVHFIIVHKCFFINCPSSIPAHFSILYGNSESS